MKKLIAVIVVALVVAAGVWIALQVQLARRIAVVPALLPETTLILAELPDPAQTRTDWRKSDLHQMWREPAVQAFLQKSLQRLPEDRGGRATLAEFLALDPKHTFLALTSLEKNEPKLIGGFHFEAPVEKAREFIGRREAKLFGKEAKRGTVVVGQHTIETVTVSRLLLASVYDNQWYFVSNDLAALRALLGRTDRPGGKGGGSLQEKAGFAAAVKHLPSAYAGLIFLDPRPFVQKLMPLVAMTGETFPLHQLQRLGRVESVAAAVGFEDGKMRETDFVAMPQVGTEKKLQRPMLGTAGTNTFFYSSSRVHWSDNLLASSAPAAVGLPALVQQFTEKIKARGISLEDLRQAFGEELEIVGDWTPNAQWPALIATLAVKDAVRARKIAEALASVEIGGAGWSRSEKSGVTFYSAQPFDGLIPIHPAIGVSDKFLCAGSDITEVEKALQEVKQPTSELEKSATFREAAALVREADSAFNYVDTRLLYERIDAAARPFLLMAATLYPAFGQSVDLAKMPPPDVIGKHLSPIIMSQRYQGDGYVTESVGPVTFREATLGMAGALGAFFLYFREGLEAGRPWPKAATEQPTATPEESVSPSPGFVSPTPSPF